MLLLQHCIAPRKPISLLASAEEPHLAISSAAGLNITLDISLRQLRHEAMSTMFHFTLHYASRITSTNIQPCILVKYMNGSVVHQYLHNKFVLPSDLYACLPKTNLTHPDRTLWSIDNYSNSALKRRTGRDKEKSEIQ